MLKTGARRDLLALAFILALALVLLWRTTLGGRALLPLDNLFQYAPWRALAASAGVERPHNALIGDMVFENYAWKSFIKDSLSQGHIPLWNPYIFAGQPFLAAGQPGVLYPLGLPFYLLPVWRSYGWFSLLHLFLGGALMYAFARTLSMRRAAALVSAVSFAFSLVVVAILLWPMVLSTIVWLPLVLLACEKVVRGFEEPPGTRPRRLLWAIVGALALGMSFLAGHVEYAFYVLFTAGFYSAGRLIAFYWRTRAWRPTVLAGVSLLAMVGLGSGLAASQLIPFYELSGHNYRSGLVDYDDVAGWALPKRHVIAFAVPDFFGNPSQHRYFDFIDGGMRSFGGESERADYPFWGTKNYVEGAAYIGVVPLLLAALALLWRRDRYTLTFGACALFALLLGFGSPLYRVFFYGVYGFNQLHTPFRWLFPYAVSASVLAGFGANALIERMQRGAPEPGERRAWRVTMWAAGAVAALGGLLLLGLIGSRIADGRSIEYCQRLLDHSTSLRGAFASAQQLYSYEFFNFAKLGLLLTLGGGLVLLALSARRVAGGRYSTQIRIGVPLALVAITAADLLHAGYGFNTASDPGLLKQTPPALAAVQQSIGGDATPGRLVSYGYDDAFYPDVAMLYGVQDARGYDAIILKRYVDYWRLMEAPHGLLYSRIYKLVEPGSLESPFLDLLNVRTVVSTGEIGLPGYTPVPSADNSVHVYSREGALPRAFAVFSEQRAQGKEQAWEAMADDGFDPRATAVIEGAGDDPALGASGAPMLAASILKYEPNEVRLSVEMPREGYLVLTDSYFPGWKARDQDGDLRVYRADYAFRAVRLSAGLHEVTFEYSPDSFKVGLYLSFVSLALLLLAGGVVLWQRFYHEAEETTIRRIAKNSLTPMGTQMLNRLADFGFAIFMLRYLGPANAGKYAFAAVFTGYFMVFTSFGLGTLLTREVARDRSTVNRYLSNSVVLQLLLSAASAPVIVGVASFFMWKPSPDRDIAGAIFLLGLAMVPSNVSLGLSAVFNAYEKMEFPALMTTITTLIRVSLGVVVLLIGWGIVGLSLVAVVSSTVTMILLFALVWNVVFHPRPEHDSHFQRHMLGESAPLMINNLLSTLFFRLDMLLLQPISGNKPAGYYSTAYKFVDGLNFIPAFFTLAIFPVMSRYAVTSRERLKNAFARALKVLLVTAMPIAAGTTIIAGRLIPFVFGDEYEPSVAALQILIWFLPFSFVNSVTQYLLIAINRQRFLTLAFFIGTCFNLAANLVAIPLWGYKGAAAVTVISELVLMAPFFYAVFKDLGVIPLWSLALRPALAAGGMALVLVPLYRSNLLLSVIAGAAAYVAFLLLLRTFDREDVAVLRALRPGRPSES